MSENNTQDAHEKIETLKSRLAPENKKSWFERIELLILSNEDKGVIAKEIVTEDGKGDKLYWMEIVLSSAIATFGLLQNSVAIIIGAMLIAPLLQPMKAMAFAISTGRSAFFWKATWFLAKSVFLSVFVALLILLVSPIQVETSEILARTTPNILDLFVAIFSAIVAFLSIAYNKLSDSVAGVAMAASLMPPLAVCGIELVLGNYTLAWGGFFLFFVNFLSILIVGVVIFMMYGFTPHEELKKKITSRKILTLVAIILLTTYPLYSSISSISEKISLHKEAENFIIQELPNHIEDAELSDLKVISVSPQEIKFFGSIRIPENVEIYQETYNLLVDNLKEKFGRDVDLRLEMVRTASFATKDRAPDFKNILQTTIRKDFPEIFTAFSLVQLETEKSYEKISAEENTILGATAHAETVNAEGNEKQEILITRLTVSVPSGEYLEEKQKILFEQKISDKFTAKNIRFVWVQIAQAPEKKILAEKTPEEKFQNILVLEWEHFFAKQFFRNIEVQNLKISWQLKPDEKTGEEQDHFSQQAVEKVIVQGTIIHPSNQRKNGILTYIKSFVSNLSYPNVELELRFIAYEAEEVIIEVPQETEEPEKIENNTSEEQ